MIFGGINSEELKLIIKSRIKPLKIYKVEKDAARVYRTLEVAI